MALILSVLVGFSVFVVLGFWNFDLMEEGLLVTVAGLAGAALPVKPLPGADVWGWSKLASVLLFAGAAAAFIGIHSSTIPLAWIFGLGIAGIVAYVGALVWLRRWRLAPA